MLNNLYALGSVIAVSVISLVGVLTIFWREERLHRILALLVSLSVGALFGDVLLHIAPEIFGAGRNVTLSASLVFVGLIIFFILEKFLRWKHAHDTDATSHESLTHLGHINLTADALHNFIDGMVIGVSFQFSTTVGFATTLAVVLHELPQEMGDFALLLHAGFSKKRALFLNFLSGCVALLGLGVALLIGSSAEAFAGYILPITAGGFLYLAGSDLVPELHKELDFKKSSQQLLAIIMGFCIMFLLLLIE
jgi:zinc and cadmium transporter